MLPTSQESGGDTQIDVGRILSEISALLAKAPIKNQTSILSKLVQRNLANCHEIIIPSDFLELSINAMVSLQEAGRSNVVYNLVKGLGSKRPNSDESRLPIKRMPMGLIEHCVNFFCASNSRQVWLEFIATLLILFI